MPKGSQRLEYTNIETQATLQVTTRRVFLFSGKKTFDNTGTLAYKQYCSKERSDSINLPTAKKLNKLVDTQYKQCYN